jgi:hypothetical protein
VKVVVLLGLCRVAKVTKNPNSPASDQDHWSSYVFLARAERRDVSAYDVIPLYVSIVAQVKGTTAQRMWQAKGSSFVHSWTTKDNQILQDWYHAIERQDRLARESKPPIRLIQM